jgi:hypothetical protein
MRSRVRGKTRKAKIRNPNRFFLNAQCCNWGYISKQAQQNYQKEVEITYPVA